MGDLTDWDEEGYREAILREREAFTLTLFRAIFPPSRLSSDADVLVAASSDGSVATYSVRSAIAGHVSSLSARVVSPRHFVSTFGLLL